MVLRFKGAQRKSLAIPLTLSSTSTPAAPRVVVREVTARRSVSYTHLDVYKRQLLCMYVGVKLFGVVGLFALPITILVMKDVYKRQPLVPPGQLW